MTLRPKHILYTLGAIIMVPFLLVGVLMALVYCPPVQKWLVNEVGERMESELGLKVHVEDVRITPFLDLIAHDVAATDVEGDTIFHTHQLTFDVAFRPLFDGRADIDGFQLQQTSLNTKSLISDCRVAGMVGELAAAAHGVDWTREKVLLDRAILKDATLDVVLTDTAAEDTTTTNIAWVVDVKKTRILNTRLNLMLPPDSVVTASETPDTVSVTSTTFANVVIGKAEMKDGHFDLGQPLYAFRQLQLLNSQAVVGSFQLLKADTLVHLTGLGANVDTLSYNKDGVLRCGVRNLTLEERRYGLNLRAVDGEVYLDSTHVEIPALNFHTLNSRINAGISLDWKALETGDAGQLKVKMDAAIGREDIRDYIDVAVREHYLDQNLLNNEYLRPFLNSDLNLKVTVSGNMSHLKVEDLDVSFPRLLTAKGNLDITDDFMGYAGRLSANYLGGLVGCVFKANLERETYDINASLEQFPLHRFVEGLAITPLTGRFSAEGRGFDPTSIRSNLLASATIQNLTVEGVDLSGLTLNANLAQANLDGSVSLQNQATHLSGNITASLLNDYEIAAQLNLDEIQLNQFMTLDEELSLHSAVTLQASATKDFETISAQGKLTENYLSGSEHSAVYRDVDFNFHTSPDETLAGLGSGDLDLVLRINDGFGGISECATKLMAEIDRQIANKTFDHETLRENLPVAYLSLHAGEENPVTRFLLMQGVDISTIDVQLNANPEEGINGDAQFGTVVVGALQLDTLQARISQDAEGIKCKATIRNYKKKNPNRFMATIEGQLTGAEGSALLKFVDEKGIVGTNVGIRAGLEDEGIRLQLYPSNPVLAYRNFTINDDNFISYNRQGVIRADMHLVADDGTGVAIYSEPTDETENDITLSLYSVNLGELSRTMPYLPRLSGTLNGDFHVIEAHGDSTSISAMGSVEALNFGYEGTALGTIGAEVMYLPKDNGEHFADAFFSVNGEDVGECSAIYNDTDGSFSGDVKLDDLPLRVLNGFMEGTDFLLSGIADGEFALSGTLDEPKLNGQLALADAHFYSPVYGVDFCMDEQPLLFDNSRLEFHDYHLNSGNSNLRVNGLLNMQDLSKILVDFNLDATKFELINTKRQSSSLVYGKVLTDFSGTVTGTIDDLLVRGNLDILPGTNATYLLNNSPLTVEDRLASLVTFMDFADTLAVEVPQETSEMRYDVSMGINIAEGASFHCFLSNSGDNYVDVKGGGNLVMRMTQNGDMRLTGRYTIEEGEMNYELPVIPMKTFQLVQGSSVEFTGDMFNPRLSISANQRTKAVVTEDDVQRTVNFIVGVDISRTLEDMGLAFTIEAPEDLSVQNQLATMSSEDRYKTAVALLATGMYVTENLTTGLKASNALNAFLQSEIQSIAGKALSTINLSFGMENGFSTAGNATTDYSFQFSKRFLGDRMSVNIGGSVTTGEDASNSAESFIDNISLEYRLDNSGTRYVRVFYDREAHDPLEGAMMKAGAGLVLRRKTDRLGDLFIFRRKK